METIRLRSRVGDAQLTYRYSQNGLPGVAVPRKIVIHFEEKNNFQANVPRHNWEELRDMFFDRTRAWKYKDVFTEL